MPAMLSLGNRSSRSKIVLLKIVLRETFLEHGVDDNQEKSFSSAHNSLRCYTMLHRFLSLWGFLEPQTG